jgi:hypothetical protein
VPWRPDDPAMVVAGSAVELYWLPLGAGHHSVRFNGVVYEATTAVIERRPRRDLYHAALLVAVPEGTYVVEMAPVPNRRGPERGVVAEAPVGARWAGRLRLFRYEVRCWRGGALPDLGYAVDGPVRVADDRDTARALLDAVASVPTPTWGRDELGAGEMWSCNSVISWVMTRAGIDAERIDLPRERPGARVGSGDRRGPVRRFAAHRRPGGVTPARSWHVTFVEWADDDARVGGDRHRPATVIFAVAAAAATCSLVSRRSRRAPTG